MNISIPVYGRFHHCRLATELCMFSLCLCAVASGLCSLHADSSSAGISWHDFPANLAEKSRPLEKVDTFQVPSLTIIKWESSFLCVYKWLENGQDLSSRQG